MKIISDTLEPVIDSWDDPGDYPSGAGSGPLPSYDYVAEVAGEIVLELESSDFTDGFPEIEYDLPHGIKVKKWDIDYRRGPGEIGLGMKVILSVAEFEADNVEQEYPEPYYEA